MYQIQKHKCFSSHLAAVFAQSLESQCKVKNEDVVGAARTGDAPATSEWSTSWLHTKVPFLLNIWLYYLLHPGNIFYHDVGEIFWPQPIRSLKLGHVTGQGSMSPTWVGRVSDPGKNGFHKKYKNLDNIAVYLIPSLKSKWKNRQIKNMNNWIW